MSKKPAQSLLAWTPWVNTPKLAEPYANKTITGQWDPIARRYIPDTGGSRALADARELLAEAGWKHGFTLDFTTSDLPFRRAEEAAVARDLARIGVHLAVRFVPQTTFLADWDHGGILSRGAFQLTVVANGGSGNPFDFSYMLESQYVARDNPEHNDGNSSGVRDPIIDQAFTRAGGTFGHRIQQASYAAIQSEINQKAHLISLYFRPSAWTADGRVANLSWSTDNGLLWNAYDWKLKTP